MSTKRILVVDDEIEFMTMLKFALEMGGDYEVREVYSAPRVLEVAREFKPDVILLDCMMPEMSGTAVACQIMADPGLKHTPFIFVTATVSEPVSRLDETGEQQVYLPKPLRLPQLISAITEKLVGKVKDRD